MLNKECHICTKSANYGMGFPRHFTYIFLLILVIIPCDKNYYYYCQSIDEKINV